jgi:hypothetical protein
LEKEKEKKNETGKSLFNSEQKISKTQEKTKHEKKTDYAIN